MALQHFEQLHQGQRGPRFTVFVAGEGIDPTTKDFGGLALIQIELSAHLGDVIRVDIGCVDLTLKLPQQLAVD